MLRFIFHIFFVLLTLPLVAQQESIPELLDKAMLARMDANTDENYRLLLIANQQENLNDYPVERSKLFGELSKHFLVINDFEQAKLYVDSNLMFSKSTSNHLAQGYAFIGAATYYNYLDIGEMAVEYAQRTIDVLKGESNASLAARAYYILYGVYSGWDDLLLTNKYAKLAIQKSSEAADYDLLANSYSAYSTVMEYRYRASDNVNYIDSISYYLQLSLKVYKGNPSVVSKRTFAISNVNLANYFFRYKDVSQQSTQDSILLYANTAKEVYMDHDRNYLIIGNVNGLLAEIAKIQGNDHVAENYLMDSYTHLMAVKSPSYYVLSNVAQGLSDLYEGKGDYDKALYYQRKKQTFAEKIFDEAAMRQTKRLESQFANKQLEAEIRVATERENQRRIQIMLLIGLCCLLIVVLVLLRRSSRNKHKLERERNLRLQQQKVDSEKRAKMEQLIQMEEQARLRSEQALLYVQQEQLQKEAMADALQIDRKNKLLIKLKEKFKALETSENVGFIEKMIKEELRLDERMEDSVRALKDIHPDFFGRLKVLSNQRLSTLELKHCAYIHLQLTTKEIASAFNVEPKSIRVSKYRIKQKLQLPKEVELDNFLQTLINNL